MKNLQRLGIVGITLLPMLFLVTLAHAQTTGDAGKFVSSPLNPQYSDIPSFLSGIFQNLVIPLSFAGLSLGFVYSGFLFAFARGNPTQLGKAKLTFYWMIIAAILLLGSLTIVALIKGTFNQLTNGNSSGSNAAPF